MSVQIPPRGTRGAFFPNLPGPISRFINRTVFRMMRNRPFNGSRLLQLTTVGARSGQPRPSTVQYFPESDNAWLIVASKGGAATHPAWFYNLAKHPDQVTVEMGSRRLPVRAQTLEGEERTSAWQRITRQAPGFVEYQTKTDRLIPVIRLTPL